LREADHPAHFWADAPGDSFGSAVSKRMAQSSALGLTALAALVLGGAATANGAAAPTITNLSPAWGARGTTVVIHGANLRHASVKWASACDPGAQGSMPTKATPIRATVNAHGTRLTFSVPKALGGPSRIAIATPAGAVSATFVVTTTQAV
jgi:hypothetical protein